MKHFLLAAALALAPIAVSAEEEAPSDPISETTTTPSRVTDGNRSAIVQIGNNNNASVVQTGRRNVAGVVQSGEGHVRNVTQTGNNQGYGSTQVNHPYRTETFNLTAGNGFTSVTLEFDVE